MFEIYREKSLWDIAIEQSAKNEGKNVVYSARYSLCVIFIVNFVWSITFYKQYKGACIARNLITEKFCIKHQQVTFFFPVRGQIGRGLSKEVVVELTT